jgi:hypothetical protein
LNRSGHTVCSLEPAKDTTLIHRSVAFITV